MTGTLDRALGGLGTAASTEEVTREPRAPPPSRLPSPAESQGDTLLPGNKLPGRPAEPGLLLHPLLELPPSAPSEGPLLGLSLTLR